MISPQSPSSPSSPWSLDTGRRWRKLTSCYLSALHFTYMEKRERMEPSDQTRKRLCKFSQLGLGFHFYQTLNKYNFPQKSFILSWTQLPEPKIWAWCIFIATKNSSELSYCSIFTGEQRKPNRSISLSRKTRQSQIGNIVTDRKLNCPSPYLLCQGGFQGYSTTTLLSIIKPERFKVAWSKKCF